MDGYFPSIHWHGVAGVCSTVGAHLLWVYYCFLQCDPVGLCWQSEERLTLTRVSCINVSHVQHLSLSHGWICQERTPTLRHSNGARRANPLNNKKPLMSEFEDSAKNFTWHVTEFGKFINRKKTSTTTKKVNKYLRRLT